MPEKTKLYNSFIKVFEPAMSERGYEIKNKVFHRIVNGKIIQLLSYRSYGNNSFTIQFTIQPLCVDRECPRCIDDNTIFSVFGVGDWENDMFGYERFMPEALELTREYLFPLFDTTTTYETYLKNMDRINRLNLVMDEVYYINLYLGNYITSQRSRELVMANWLKKLEKLEKHKGTEFYNNTLNIYRKIYKDYQDMKAAMDANDRQFIEAHIHMLEQKMLESYIKTFYDKHKYDVYINNGIPPFKTIRI